MKILSIETSAKLCGACLLEDKTKFDKIELDNGLTHSEILMPLIKNLLDRNNLKIKDIDNFICDIGPGSFTGIRIGVATVKAFIDSNASSNFTGVSSLESLAYNITDDGLICSIIDCNNSNCYFALYNLIEGNYFEVVKPSAASIKEALSVLQEYSNNRISFVGDGSVLYKNEIINGIKNVKFAKDSLNKINSYNLAIAGLKRISDKNTLELLPMYLKKPQAQRQLEDRIKIEKMTNEDLEKISTTLTNEFDNFWNYNVLKQELQNETSHLFIAKNEHKEIVGFAGIQLIFDEASINNIVTKKAFRNTGIGSLLLDKLIDFAKQKKANSITLEVNENNNYALKLYKKFGFKTKGLRKNYYNGVDNAIIMTLEL